MSGVTDLQPNRKEYEYNKNIMLALQKIKKSYFICLGDMKLDSKDRFQITSPINESINLGSIYGSKNGMKKEAVSAALEAFKEWSKSSVFSRVSYFMKFLNTIKCNKPYYAAVLTVSSSMVYKDAMLEVDQLICIITRLMNNIKSSNGKRPYGVWTIISIHNSPFASPVGYAISAMMAGNTIIMCPSEYCPIPVYIL